MDELVDILDSNGNFTGEVAMKSVAHRKGWFHSTVHIWLYTKDQTILVQQRGRNKDTHPLLWDVSVAGHIGAGEEIEIAAIREVEEEIGLDISKNNLEKIGVFKSIQKHSNELIDCEFHHAFLYELKVPLKDLTKQKDEVKDLKLIPLLQFSEGMFGEAHLNKYVPHEVNYYAEIIRAIKNKLERL